MAVWPPEANAAVRRNLGDDVEPYSVEDDAIQNALDSSDGDVQLASGLLWKSIAARHYTLVDITEAGSSRKNSAIFANAVKMAALFGVVETTEDTSVPVLASRTRAIRRA